MMGNICFTFVSTILLFSLFFISPIISALSSPIIYGVVNTWPWTAATDAAWETLSSSSSSTSSPIDAAIAGCTKCEELQCDGTVGFGGSPDDNGETTLDALVMNGDTFAAGTVGGLKRIKNAVGVARAVMDYTDHTLIVGESATQFALSMGFIEEDLHTNSSISIYNNWIKNNCQPNYRKNVYPDPLKQCGPYKPADNNNNNNNNDNDEEGEKAERLRSVYGISKENHDTIAMIVLGKNGSMAAATSTNGANHKVAGRVGDSPIIGSGAYVDSSIGGCGGTGDGDVMMRFSASLRAVLFMEQGMNPSDAATASLRLIAAKFPSFTGALVCLNNKGEHGGAGYGWNFSYSVRTNEMNQSEIIHVPPFNL